MFLLLLACAPPEVPLPNAAVAKASAAYTLLSGVGNATATVVPDPDGDGDDDVLVVEGGVGQLFAGGPDGVSSTASQVLAGSLGDGVVVAAAGDVNGDGLGDFVVGEPSFDGGRGRVLVYHGARGLLPTRPATVLLGRNATAGMGVEVAGLGDTDGDGYDELAVFATGAARILVFSGGRRGLGWDRFAPFDAAWHTTFSLPQTDAPTSGRALLGADVNGDGYADLVAGAPAANEGQGQIRVFLGGKAGLGSSGRRLDHPHLGETYDGCDGEPALGWSLAAGDLDGDGIDDVAVGAPEDYCYGFTYTWFGGTRGLGDHGEAVGWECGSGGGFGDTLAVGDLDGDGVADLAAGMAGGACTLRGPLLVIDEAYENLGYPSVLDGTTNGARVARTRVSGVGDVNADGYADLVVSAPLTRDGWGTGVWYGGP